MWQPKFRPKDLVRAAHPMSVVTPTDEVGHIESVNFENQSYKVRFGSSLYNGVGEHELEQVNNIDRGDLVVAIRDWKTEKGVHFPEAGCQGRVVDVDGWCVRVLWPDGTVHHTKDGWWCSMGDVRKVVMASQNTESEIDDFLSEWEG